MNIPLMLLEERLFKTLQQRSENIPCYLGNYILCLSSI